VTLARLRAIVLVCCVCGIAGMIVSTIATDNNNGWVMSFGFLTALPMLTLLVASHLRPVVTPDHEALAARIEDKVSTLVSQGAEEADVRSLLGDAVSFGRTRT
jgi:Na+(H+)/acetate symporter ActP